MRRARGLSGVMAVWHQRLGTLLIRLRFLVRSRRSILRENEQLRHEIEQLERRGVKRRKPTAAERLELQRLGKKMKGR